MPSPPAPSMILPADLSARRALAPVRRCDPYESIDARGAGRRPGRARGAGGGARDPSFRRRLSPSRPSPSRGPVHDVRSNRRRERPELRRPDRRADDPAAGQRGHDHRERSPTAPASSARTTRRVAAAATTAVAAACSSPPSAARAATAARAGTPEPGVMTAGDRAATRARVAGAEAPADTGGAGTPVRVGRPEAMTAGDRAATAEPTARARRTTTSTHSPPPPCDSSLLTQGASLLGAQLELTGNGVVFEGLELLPAVQ